MKIVIALFVLCGFKPITEVVSVEKIRNSYKYCNSSKEKADEFYELTQKGLKNMGAVYKGYHGAALALKASFGWNPISKLSHFNKGKKMIEEAIQAEPENIELRMIRLSIQANAPKIVGYYKNIDEDKDFMLKNVEAIKEVELKEYIEGYIDNAPEFSN